MSHSKVFFKQSKIKWSQFPVKMTVVWLISWPWRKQTACAGVTVVFADFQSHSVLLSQTIICNTYVSSFFFFFVPSGLICFFFSLPPNEQTDRSPEEVGLGHCLVSLCHRWRICCHVKWRGGVEKKKQLSTGCGGVRQEVGADGSVQRSSQPCFAGLCWILHCNISPNNSLWIMHQTACCFSNIKNDQVKIDKFNNLTAFL